MPVQFTSWTATCCDILEQNAQTENDGVLVAMTRISNTVSDTGHAYAAKGPPEQQSRLVLLGIEAQFREVQQRIPPQVGATSECSDTELQRIGR